MDLSSHLRLPQCTVLTCLDHGPRGLSSRPRMTLVAPRWSEDHEFLKNRPKEEAMKEML